MKITLTLLLFRYQQNSLIRNPSKMIMPRDTKPIPTHSKMSGIKQISKEKKKETYKYKTILSRSISKSLPSPASLRQPTSIPTHSTPIPISAPCSHPTSIPTHSTLKPIHTPRFYSSLFNY